MLGNNVGCVQLLCLHLGCAVARGGQRPLIAILVTMSTFSVVYAVVPPEGVLFSSSLRQVLELHVSARLSCQQVLSWGHPGGDAVAAGEVSGAAQRAAVRA